MSGRSMRHDCLRSLCLLRSFLRLLRPFRRGALFCAALCCGLTASVAYAAYAHAADAGASAAAVPRAERSAADAAEERLAAISSGLRCLVCQNESLAASQAGLARDLRREILAMIAAGKSDGEIVDFMVSRYGDFIRYQPPFKPSTWLLWVGPFLWLAGGLGLLLVVLRRQRHAAEAPLNTADRQRADRLLADEGSDRVEKER